jgi:hypothetical protein
MATRKSAIRAVNAPHPNFVVTPSSEILVRHIMARLPPVQSNRPSDVLGMRAPGCGQAPMIRFCKPRRGV